MRINYINQLATRIQFREIKTLISAHYKLKISHKTRQSLEYVNKCIEFNLEPKIQRISDFTKEKIGMNKGETFKFGKRRLKKEMNTLNEKLKITNFQIDKLFFNI
jgi:3-oxoacyl-[acyl-carrier-protein] synthase III